MSRTYIISPDPRLVVIKDEEGNTYAEWTRHCMDKRFKAKMFHRKGKELAKILRARMHPDDILFYFRSVDDDSGVVQKRSRVKAGDSTTTPQELQLTLPFYQSLN